MQNISLRSSGMCRSKIVFGFKSPWPLKLMTSQRIERTWIRMGGYGRFRGEWVNMCHWIGNSENSGGCSYLLRICFICGTNVSVSQSWIPLQVADREQGAFWFTNKRVQIKILSILKLVSFESLAGNDFSARGSQAETHCKRNLNRQLWSFRPQISHPCSSNFFRFYHKS